MNQSLHRSNSSRIQAAEALSLYFHHEDLLPSIHSVLLRKQAVCMLLVQTNGKTTQCKPLAFQFCSDCNSQQQLALPTESSLAGLTYSSSSNSFSRNDIQTWGQKALRAHSSEQTILQILHSKCQQIFCLYHLWTNTGLLQLGLNGSVYTEEPDGPFH